MYLSNKLLSLLLFIYMSVIFFLSQIPSGTDNKLDLDRFQWLSEDLGNLLHVPLYAGLAYLWIKFFQAQQVSERKMRVWVGVLSLAYAISDEAHQFFVPGRFASFSDLILDAIGILLMLKAYPLVDATFRVKVTR